MNRPSLAAALGAALLAAALPAKGEMVDRVAAVVNNEIITLGEVQKRASFELSRLDPSSTGPERQAKHEETIKRTLEALIDEQVLDQELREMKIVIDDKQIDLSVQEVMKRYNFDADQLAQAVANEGLTMAEYRDQMKKQLGRYQLLREKVQKKIKVSEADIRSEYDRMAREEGREVEVHVRHILVLVGENAPAAEVEKALAKAKLLAAEARQPGVDFAALAKKKSEGSSAADGGDLGFFKRGAMVAAFEKVAYSLKPGEISDPIRTSLGWHVLKLEETRAVGIAPLSELKPEIEEKLRQQLMTRASAQYIQQLRAAAVVENKLYPSPTASADKKR